MLFQNVCNITDPTHTYLYILLFFCPLNVQYSFQLNDTQVVQVWFLVRTSAVFLLKLNKYVLIVAIDLEGINFTERWMAFCNKKRRKPDPTPNWTIGWVVYKRTPNSMLTPSNLPQWSHAVERMKRMKRSMNKLNRGAPSLSVYFFILFILFISVYFFVPQSLSYSGLLTAESWALGSQNKQKLWLKIGLGFFAHPGCL